MISAGTLIWSWLRAHILLITFLGLMLSIANLSLSCLIETYTNAGEDVRSNTLFNEIKLLEAHLIRIDDFLIIIDNHLDFVDSRQNKDSMKYKTYKIERQKILTEIQNETNSDMISFACNAIDSEKYYAKLNEQKQPYKYGLFIVMAILLFFNAVSFLLQFDQNRVSPHRDIPLLETTWDEKNSDNYDDISYQ